MGVFAIGYSIRLAFGASCMNRSARGTESILLINGGTETTKV
ncbi:hypothetical protein V12B01_13335 [Vibrio splendidus 12B01]|nr:hypothetical protein V12B01_13335 [Vibrio splendidus 12B01]